MGALALQANPELTSVDIDDVIVMGGTQLRHALLRRAIRARGNDYVLRTLRRRRVWYLR